MANIQTVKQPEQWLVEVNGGYDICFKEVQLAANAVDGQVIAVGTAKGIVSAGGVTGAFVRVMVRGNPSLVDKSQLTGADAAAVTALAAVGIIVK